MNGADHKTDKNSAVRNTVGGKSRETVQSGHGGCHVTSTVGCVPRDVERLQPTMAESLRFLGSLPGHKGWVTAIATSSENPDMILTASRGIYLLHNSHSCWF